MLTVVTLAVMQASACASSVDARLVVVIASSSIVCLAIASRCCFRSRAELKLVLKVGSLMESEAERGIAHLIEV